MDKILEFLDFSSIDPYMYWRIISQDGLKTFEISWRREGNIHWRFREFGTLFWTLCDTNNVIARLTEAGVDIPRFENALRSSLMHQVCFADNIVRESRLLLGTDAVEKGIREHQEFLGQLEEVATRMYETKNTPPKLRVIKD